MTVYPSLIIFKTRIKKSVKFQSLKLPNLKLRSGKCQKLKSHHHSFTSIPNDHTIKRYYDTFNLKKRDDKIHDVNKIQMTFQSIQSLIIQFSMISLYYGYLALLWFLVLFWHFDSLKHSLRKGIAWILFEWNGIIEYDWNWINSMQSSIPIL